MSNHLATVNCEFEHANGTFVLGLPIKGRFWVTPKKDLQYKYIRYSVILKIEAIGGATKFERATYTAHLVGSPGEWKKTIPIGSPPYEYPFQFYLQQPISYTGQYFRVKWFIQFEAEMTAASKKALRKIAMERLNIQRIIFPSSKINERFGFTLKRGTRQLRALDKFYEVKIEHPVKKYWIPTAIGAAGVVWTWLAHIHMVIPIFDIIGATGLGVGLYQSVVGFGRLGSLKFEVMPNTVNRNTFDVKTTIQQNWSKVQKIGVHYEVVEQVSGSDSKTKSVTQYRPKMETQKSVSSNTTIIQVEFPKRDLPPTMSLGSYAVIWRLYVSVYLTNGKKKTYNFHFGTQL